MTSVEELAELQKEIEKLKKDCKEWEQIANLGYYKEFRVEQAKAKALEDDLAKYKAFYNDFSEHYGKNLQVSNYHKNGNFEPFDNFYDYAERAMENAAIKPTIDLKA